MSEEEPKKVIFREIDTEAAVEELKKAMSEVELAKWLAETQRLPSHHPKVKSFLERREGGRG